MRDRAGAVLYTRRACPLCFALGRLADRSSRRHGVSLIEMDVDDHPALLARYGDRVPVLELPGGSLLCGGAGAREVDEGFARAADFLRDLERRPPGDRGGDERRARSGITWFRRLLGLGGGGPGDRAA